MMKLNDLPVLDVIPEIKIALSEQYKAILIAPPGAGKTTAVPLKLLQEDWLAGKKIIMLEPRRLAARTAARRMAASLDEPVGQTVGYRMRFDTKVSANTKIEIVTEGVFQRMIVDDPELGGVGCVIFDEFHERSLDADFGLALTLDVMEALREDLRLLIMSATLDGPRVSAFLDEAPIIESKGRMHPVDIKYLPRNADQRIEDTMAGAIRKMLMEEEGSILAFLPGQAEIRRTAERLDGRLPDNVFVAPLFGAMDICDQDKAVEPPPSGQRKVVLATSLAESSITIDGVRIIIDSGLARLPSFEANLGISRLETKRASIASVTQRAGRAGRTAPGIAVRLWQEEQTAALPDFEQPEIMQTDLSALLLDCVSWGVSGPEALRFLDQPPKAHIDEARKLLIELGAIDPTGAITAKGKIIGALGLEPRLAAMIAAGTSRQDCECRSMLGLLMGERGLGGNDVDLAARFERVWRDNSTRARSAKQMAGNMAKKVEAVSNGGEVSVGLMLCDAFPDRLARRRDNRQGSYVLTNGRGVMIDETAALASHQFLVVTDLIGSAANARIVSAAAIEENEVTDFFADQISERDYFTFDKATSRLKGQRKRQLGAITLSAVPLTVEPGEATTDALVAAVRQYGLGILPWGKKSTELKARLAWLHAHQGDWPNMSDDALCDALEEWLAPFLAGKTRLTDLADNDIASGLMTLVPYQLHMQLDELAPTHYVVPTGSKIPLTYNADGAAPVLSVRVQELFGLATHPAICNGKVPLTIEMLSPAHRPIQLTQDLPGFWSGSWRDMRADMRGRYPRHEWPEDPAQAAPTRRAKPRK
ncbi:ATP-dependent helicase HrpB [Ahrensia marina]|uniref:ATP-dependent helicase n=1 Tax=Ahrensia marina TaxID=1514904 RepID=A0A0N0VM05_9HYPH|nr:ATP-dependent helicase HrpB [Ahrensia marina]KPB01884.1 ATP-dependent helicase [Ahrensia marina]